MLIAGMNCAHCARTVTDALQGVAGVAGARVSLQDGRACVRWRTGATPNLPALSEAVRAAGFAAKPAPADTQAGPPAPMDGWRFNVIAGLAGTVPLMAGEWVFHLGLETWFHWLAFALVLPVQILCGARFYKGAWLQLKSGRSNMDTLVALGSTAAFGFSVCELFSGAGGHLFFMEASAIITLISIGHWLEDDDSEDFPFYEMNYKNHALPEDFHVSRAVQEVNFICEKLVIHVESLEVKRMTKCITKETGIYKVTVEKL